MKEDITDPNKYSNRDLLLLLQLLHTNGLIQPSSISNPANKHTLQHICHEWFNHKSTSLSIMNGLDIENPWLVEQLVQLYNNLREKYPDCDTTAMANIVYSDRIQELEAKLESSQQLFDDLISKPIK